MQSKFTTSSAGSQDVPAPQTTRSSSKALPLLRITQYLIILSLGLFILDESVIVTKSAMVVPTTAPTYNRTISLSPSAEQNVHYQASLIRENLPVYLDFVGREVLPLMTKNIDDILHNLNGLTDIRLGLFYHGHIDYSIYVSGGIEELMEMNNVVLQYHTLENPLIYIPYWREELGNIDDQNIKAWLERINEYNKAISTPSAVSGVEYTPLAQDESVDIAAHWDDYRRQNGLPSPGLEMLTNMVYLVDGGKQPLYQESYKKITRFHSIAFSSERYLQLENKTHFQNTFSPFQINFERVGNCQQLLPVFQEASAAGFAYILNTNNVYVAQNPELLHGSASPVMMKLSMRLIDAINSLPDDNLMKISNIRGDQQIAFFASGNYVFALSGSLDSPSIFE